MQRLKGSNLSKVKISNQSAILRMIYLSGPIQRSEIAERLGLTLPTITTNINSMLANGILREEDILEPAQGASGRKAHKVNIREDSRLFMGIELKGFKRSACVVDFRGNILYSQREPLSNSEYTVNMDNICQTFLKCLKQCGRRAEDICGVGICMPGLVDRESGILKVSPRYHWYNKNIQEDFRRLTGYQGRVTIDNNGCARALGEQLYGREELRDASSFAYLFVSAGIACPLIINDSGDGSTVVGSGEVGHMVMMPRGRKCNCGNRGCLEAYASENAILAQCVELMREGKAVTLRNICANPAAPKMSEILKAQKAKDPEVSAVVEEAIYMLGVAVANVINFTGPDVMLIDCRLFNEENNRWRLIEIANSNLCSLTYSGTDIAFVKPDHYSGARGAAAVAILDILENYI